LYKLLEVLYLECIILDQVFQEFKKAEVDDQNPFQILLHAL